MGIKCFMVVAVPLMNRYLRRHATGPCGDGGEWSYHNAMVYLDQVDHPLFADRHESFGDESWPRDDPRWPTQCEKCGLVFPDRWDNYQLFTRTLYKREDTGELFEMDQLPVGAMFDAHWLHDWAANCGPDGRSMHVKCPGGHVWNIDGMASNCNWTDRPHKCWHRTGEPPDLHVDHEGLDGHSGGGSIQTPNWHGYLSHGELRESR